MTADVRSRFGSHPSAHREVAVERGGGDRT